MQFKDLKKFIKTEDRRLRVKYGNYKDEEKRVLARTVKLTEELGELCDEVLAYNSFQRKDKLEKHNADIGLKLTLKDFRQILNEEGLLEIDAAGKDFDSNVMEAIETIDGEEGRAVEIVSKGYMLKNKLLRPAKVKVGQKHKEENKL